MLTSLVDPNNGGLSPDAVFASCPSGIVQLLRRRRLEVSLGIPKDQFQIGDDYALAIWVGDLLLRELPEHVDGIWTWLQSTDNLPGKLPWTSLIDNIYKDHAPVLALSGGRYVGLTFVKEVYDLMTGDWLTSLPESFETRLFNLQMLYLSCREKATKWTPPRV